MKKHEVGIDATCFAGVMSSSILPGTWRVTKSINRSQVSMLATERTHCRERHATPTRTERSDHEQKELEKALSQIYLVALIMVALALLAGLADAIWSVSRRPTWGVPAPELTLVETVERRQQNLPFVGRDRRRAAVKAQPEVDEAAA